MKPKRFVIDCNAHIRNLDYSIIADDNSAQALISFENMDMGAIKAIKFNAKGFNTFGDLIHVSNEDTFQLIIQDIYIAENSFSGELKVNLPNKDIRILELEENQIYYDDDSIVSYSGKNECVIETEEFDETDPDENKQLEAISSRLSNDFKYLPKENEMLWLCGCGYHNSKEKTSCSQCGIDKETAFEVCNEGFIDSLVEQYDADIEEWSKQIKSNRIIKIIGVVLLVGVVLLCILPFAILSNRKSFSSEEEMKDWIRGSYTNYFESNGAPYVHLFIYGNTLTTQFEEVGDLKLNDRSSNIVKWSYKTGSFETDDGKKYIVLKDGNVKIKGESLIYQNDNNQISQEPQKSTKPIDYENGFSVLELSVDSLESNTSFTVCNGSINNTGSLTYKFVKVKGTFLDSDGNVLDTSWTYAVGLEGISAGESSTFRMSVPKNKDITKVRVTIIDYEY